jgi:hypothetical protein
MLSDNMLSSVLKCGSWLFDKICYQLIPWCYIGTVTYVHVLLLADTIMLSDNMLSGNTMLSENMLYFFLVYFTHSQCLADFWLL